MRTLHIDPSHGAAGDMFLSAFAHLGLDTGPLGDMFIEAGLIEGLGFVTADRNAIRGMTMLLEAAPEQPLRHMEQIVAVLAGLPVSESVRARAVQAFERLAHVEARVHGVDPSEVHFHEVGAVDTLVDVVGVFWALEALDIRMVTCDPLPWFRGTVRCEHGEIPLPAPAVAELYRGKPTVPTDACYELVTPTGALLIDQLVQHFGQRPGGVLDCSGTGYGSYPDGGGLRLYLLETTDDANTDAAETSIEQVWVLESNVDHLTGEELGAFFEALEEAGALDVLYTHGVMKKNRPGGSLQVICGVDDLDRVQKAFFAHSLTLGIRRRLEERVVLQRGPAALESTFGEIQAKETRLGGERFVRPEHDALTRAAQEAGLSPVQLRYKMYGK